MTNKPNLLISGLGGSLFPYLHESLIDYFTLYYVDGDLQLKYLYKNLNFFHAPLVTTNAYEAFIKQIITDKQIDFYIPLIDEEIVMAKRQIEGYNNVKVVTPTVAFSDICLDKFRLMRNLHQSGISSVLSFKGDDFNDQLDFPLFVKPVSGRGSRGIKIISNAKQLSAYYILEDYKPSDILIQPLLMGIEYTVGVLVSDRNEFIGISSKRIIKKKGITQIAVTENLDVIDEVARKIVDIFQPRGPFNIQLILTPENEVKIFEINPRFSTTTVMEIEGGFNPIISYINFFNKESSGEVLRPKQGVVLHRRWENMFYEQH